VRTLAPLKRVADIRVSNVDKKSVDGQLPVRLCNYTDVYYRDQILPDQDFMAATATVEQVQQFRLRTGDVLITKDSETADDIAVPTFVAGEAPDLVCGYHLAVLRPRPWSIDPKFLYWSIVGDRAKEQFSISATGVTRYGLRQDEMGRVEIDLPPLAQQRVIAAYLDTETARIDTLIATKQRLVEAMTLRSILVVDGWVSDLGEAHGWIALRRLLNRIEQGWSPACDSVEAEPAEWGVLKTSAVSSGAFRARENKRLPPNIPPDLRWVVSDGDLLVVRGSGSASKVGQAAVAQTGGRKLMLSDLVYRLVLREGDPDFMAAILRSSRERSALESSIRTDAGQTLKVRVDDLQQLQVPHVPAQIQRTELAALRRRLDPVDRAVRRIGDQLQLVREHRQALITAAVMGDLEIPGATAA
jgi:type I restriction enzyme S subunit